MFILKPFVSLVRFIGTLLESIVLALVHLVERSFDRNPGLVFFVVVVGFCIFWLYRRFTPGL